jgi:hypothetical protein
MATDDTPHDEPHANQYDILQAAIQAAQDQAESVVEDLYEADHIADAEDLSDTLEAIEDSSERAEDTDNPDELSNAPAHIEYLQAFVPIIAAEVDANTEPLMRALEDVEDHLDRFDIELSKWFARVNEIPLRYDKPDVDARILIEDARNPEEPTNYLLKGWADTDHTQQVGEFDPADGDKVPIDEIDEFTTERNRGGGQV